MYLHHIPNTNTKSYPKNLRLPLDEQMQRLAVHDHIEAFLRLPCLGCWDLGCFHGLLGSGEEEEDNTWSQT